MEPSFWAMVIEKSATAALAIFAIWVLTKEYKDRLAAEKTRAEQERVNRKEERDQLLGVITRNTDGWLQAAQTMAQVASGMVSLTDTMEAIRQDTQDTRILLAERPCTSGAQARKGKE